MMNYQTFYENAVEGIFQTTPTGQFLSANPALVRLYGCDNVATLLHPTVNVGYRRYVDVQRWQAFTAQIAAHGTVQAFEAEVYRANGDRIWVAENVRSVTDAAGTLLYYEGTSIEITPHKHAAVKLQAQYSRYAIAINVGLIGVWDWDVTTDTIFIAPNLKHLLGYQDSEIPNEMAVWMTLVHPDDIPLVEAAATAHFQGKTPQFELEHRMIHKTGAVRWFLARGQAQRNNQGEVVRMIGTDMDVTEQKRIEAAQHQSEERFRAIFEQANVGMNIADLSGRFIQVNQALCNLVGYSVAELLQMTYQELTYLPDLEAERRLVDALLSHTIQTYSLEKRYVCKDGTLKWVHVHVSQVTDADGAIAFCTAIIEDISDRKQHEAALRQSEATHRAIITAIPDILMRIRHDGTYLDMAGSPTVKLFCPKEMAVGQTVEAILPPAIAQKLMATIHQALQTQQLQIYEQQIEIEGTLYDEELRVTPINTDETLVMVRDITARKRAETELKRQADRDRALNQVTQAIRNSLDLDQIFSTAVYEFAQLLNAGQVLLLQYIPTERLWRSIAFYSADPQVPNVLDLEITDLDNALTAQLKRLELVQLADANLCEDLANPAIAQLLPGAWLLIPVQLQGLWGCLGLVRHPQMPWQPAEVELVMALTNQLAIAIQQSELYQQLQQLNTRLEQQVHERTGDLRRAVEFDALLKRITDKVRDSLDENQILQAAVDALGMGMAVDCCISTIYTADLTAHTITHEFQTAHPGILGQTRLFTEYPTIEIFTQLLAGQCIQFCWLADQSAHPQLFAHEQFGAVLVCPLMDDHGVLGDLWLYRQTHAAFDEVELRLVQQVANQCAIALRQSHLYQSAQAQVQELERLNRLKDDFLNTVSHELRTPMANIKMATEMLELEMTQQGVLDNGAPPRDRLPRYLTILKEECRREIHLINDLLDLSRLDSGTDPLMLGRFNLQYWLPHIAEIFAERIQQQQQQLFIDIPETIPAIETDFNYLELILSELFHNACKYTPAGGTIRVIAAIVPDRAIAPDPAIANTPNGHPLEASQLQLSISNSGVEIPSTELGHVFDKFYRVPNNDPWKHGGTGLGLALVKKRVERLNGTITATSAEGWTTFTVQVPWQLRSNETYGGSTVSH